MLRIVIDGEENWDQDKQVFVYPDQITVTLEHSLVALSKWEAKYEKPFLSEEEKTNEELMYYVQCMMVGEDDPTLITPRLTQEHVTAIQKHIDAKQTATWFADTPTKKNTQVITNELIYYWIFAAGIDKSCESWHLNRLFTLLRVHSAHNEQQANSGKKKKFTASDAAKRAAENERRRALYESKG